MENLKGQRQDMNRIEGDRIVLDGQSKFPKELVILEKHGKKRKYKLEKKPRGYCLNS